MAENWIPTADNVPELDVPVLVTDGKTRWVAYRNFKRWVSIPGRWNSEATHWMPLPPMPSTTDEA